MKDRKVKDDHAGEPRSGAGSDSGTQADERDAVASDPTAETLDAEPGTETANQAVETGTAADAAIDFRDRWLRTEADLQNYRRRSQRDLEESVRSAEDRLLLEMISLLDDLERALEASREGGAPDPWIQGVQLVANRMQDTLARQGVRPMDPIGRPFDPEHHEALLEIDPPAEAAPGSVVQVVRKGYQRDQRPLRPARVVVARSTVREGGGR